MSKHLFVAKTLLATGCAFAGMLAPTAVSAGPVIQGPILQGPILQGPVLQGPIIQGPTVQGPAVRVANSGATQIVRVTLADGTVVSLR